MSSPSHVGPWLVLLGALLWATDAIFRSSLTPVFPPILIVTISHLICLPVTLGALLTPRYRPKEFTRQQMFALLILSLGGSVTAMICFTQAFAITTNYNIPILLQKLQPIIAILLARTLLGEKPTKSFYFLAIIALVGGYLISFGDLEALTSLQEGRIETIAFSLAAAMIWGACTVAGRYILGFHSQMTVTACRYLLATIFLIIATSLWGYWGLVSKLTWSLTGNFVLMAYIPGLLALFIYYSGLKSTPATLATIGELGFPLGAIFVNWYLLNSPLTVSQVVGALLLIFSTTVIHWRWSQNHRLIVHQAKV